LGANGWSLQASEEEAVLETLALAAGETAEADYAAWLAKNAVSA
jgi:prophage maintenance system killer protein